MNNKLDFWMGSFLSFCALSVLLLIMFLVSDRRHDSFRWIEFNKCVHGPTDLDRFEWCLEKSKNLGER